MRYIRVLPAEFQAQQEANPSPDSETLFSGPRDGIPAALSPNCHSSRFHPTPVSADGCSAQSDAQLVHKTDAHHLFPRRRANREPCYTCQQCGKMFWRKKKGPGKVHRFCSPGCSAVAKTGRPVPGFTTPESDKAERLRANGLVNMRLRRGWFEKPPRCMKCGRKKKLDSHHTDYSKPDHVYWLCRSCHVKTHHNPSILDGIAPFVCDEKIPREQRGPVLVDYVPRPRRPRPTPQPAPTAKEAM